MIIAEQLIDGVDNVVTWIFIFLAFAFLGAYMGRR